MCRAESPAGLDHNAVVGTVDPVVVMQGYPFAEWTCVDAPLY